MTVVNQIMLSRPLAGFGNYRYRVVRGVSGIEYSGRITQYSSQFILFHRNDKFTSYDLTFLHDLKYDCA